MPSQPAADSAGDRAPSLASAAIATQPPEPVTTAKAQEQSAPKTLQIMPFVTLGLGMGIGGVLGIVFMLTVGYINHGRAKR